MSELERRMERLRGHLEPPWSAAREARVRAGLARRHRRSLALRAAAAAGAVLLLLGVGQLLRGRGEVRLGEGGEVRLAEGPEVRLADGSAARPLGAGSALRPLPAESGRVAVALDRGAARFRAAPDRRRALRVEAGPVSVEALGARFVVSRRGAKVAVFIEEGQARVRWLGGEEVLVAGSGGTFPRDDAPTATASQPPASAAPAATPAAAAPAGPPAHATPLVSDPPAAAAPAPATPLVSDPPAAAAPAPATPLASDPPAAAAPAVPPAPATPLASTASVGGAAATIAGVTASALAPLRPAPRPREAPRAEGPAPRPAITAERARWQDLAQDGDYDRAFTLLRDGDGPRDDPQELLLAADVARLSHHPEAAIAPLQQTVDHHRSDPRAPLAAFTLGRVLLDGLGRPRQAAAAFRAAQELDAAGPLAQDALAREVEAWSRADEERVARQRALEYVRRHPDGPRLRAVRRHGGLE